MAYVFQLWVEANDAEATAHLATAFQDLSPVQFESKEFRIKTVVGDRELRIFSPDLPNRGDPETIDEARWMTAVGISLLHHLRHAPAFERALLGVEVDANVLATHSLSQGRLPFWWQDTPLVLSEQAWVGLGSPSLFFLPFRPGYRWSGYSGEAFRPMLVDDALEALASKLLPD